MCEYELNLKIIAVNSDTCIATRYILDKFYFQFVLLVNIELTYLADSSAQRLLQTSSH